jgi:CRP-like cAMP-binding protein
VTAERAELLGRVSLLESLDYQDLERLAGTMRELEFEAGSTIIREGERGARVAAFFLLLEGEVAVAKRGTEVGRLREGDFLGETALLLERPRTATVTAVTNVRCLTTSAAEFRTFVDAHPEVSWLLLEAMAERLTDDDDD